MILTYYSTTLSLRNMNTDYEYPDPYCMLTQYKLGTPRRCL